MCSLTGLFSAGHLWLALLCYHLMKWLSGLRSSLIPQRGGGHPLICIVLEMLYMVLWVFSCAEYCRKDGKTDLVAYWNRFTDVNLSEASTYS